MVSVYTESRFGYLPREQVNALHNYTYALCNQPGSGDYALGRILKPSVYARSPLINRVHRLGRQEGETGLPVVFLYGSYDWMDKEGGRGAVKVMDKVREDTLKKASEKEKALENGSGKVIVINNAGHHVHLDGADEFNEVVTKELVGVEEHDAYLERMSQRNTTMAE